MRKNPAYQVESATCAITFTGRRKENQDGVVVLKLPGDYTLLAVADGMGGHQGGQVASTLVLSTLETHATQLLSNPPESLTLKAILTDLIQVAQAAIKNRVDQDPDLSGMGTTLTCVLIHGKNYVVGNIGDSRTYRIKEGAIEQLTVDHSAVEEFRQKNQAQSISKETYEQFGNIITRCIDGGEDALDIFPADRESFILYPNEGFLLCSDGLLPDRSESYMKELHQIILGEKTIDLAAKTLISHAYYKGSTDNISVVLLDNGLKRSKTRIPSYPYPPREQQATPPAPPRKKRKLLFSLLLTIPSLVILCGLLWIINPGNMMGRMGLSGGGGGMGLDSTQVDSTGNPMPVSDQPVQVNPGQTTTTPPANTQSDKQPAAPVESPPTVEKALKSNIHSTWKAFSSHSGIDNYTILKKEPFYFNSDQQQKVTLELIRRNRDTLSIEVSATDQTSGKYAFTEDQLNWISKPTILKIYYVINGQRIYASDSLNVKDL